MSDFLNFKYFLPKAMKRYHVTRQARAAQVCHRFRELAPRVIGEDTPRSVRPKFFKGHTLYVSVPDSVWAQHVYVHRHELITQLNLHLGEAWVHDIRTQVDG